MAHIVSLDESPWTKQAEIAELPLVWFDGRIWLIKKEDLPVGMSISLALSRLKSEAKEKNLVCRGTIAFDSVSGESIIYFQATENGVPFLQ